MNTEQPTIRCSSPACSGGLAATEATDFKPRSGADHSGALLCAEKPGPLAARIKNPAADPVPAKKKPKPKGKPVKRLRLFSDFDDRGFHPTLELAWSPDGFLCQLWRHKDTDEPEWRTVPHIPAKPLTISLTENETVVEVPTEAEDSNIAPDWASGG